MFELVDVNVEKEMDDILHYVAKNLDETGHNTKPVLLHSFKVGMTLYSCNYDLKIITAGLLHDLIEDTDVLKEEISEKFTPEIANIVEAVSFNPNIADKLEQAREMFKNCCEYGRDALVVKCADLLDNINFVHLVDDMETRNKLLKKYILFLDMSKDIIGNEIIYQMLSKKADKLGLK